MPVASLFSSKWLQSAEIFSLSWQKTKQNTAEFFFSNKCEGKDCGDFKHHLINSSASNIAECTIQDFP